MKLTLPKTDIVNAKTVTATDLPHPKHTGKVRDTYDLGDELLLVTTDRLSAFDRHIATIPFKGEVLNQVSAWWLEQTKHIIANHFIAIEDARSMRVKKCRVIPIEVVVRGYMTGTTNTSIWTLYQQGERQFFDTTLPDGLTRNQALPQPILTPTTKDIDHDRPLTPEMLQSLPQITAEQWQYIAEKAKALFAFGQQVAAKEGLILVDTKYEFGIDVSGEIILIDECHTPDSSRYWDATTYQANIAAGKEPDNFDKEIIRLWFREHCDPYADDTLPEAPEDLVVKVAQCYWEIYRRLVG